MKIYIQLISFFLIFNIHIYSVVAVNHPPSETVILKLPGNSHLNWKILSHNVAEKKGTIERIPLDQTMENWSELISVQFSDRSIWDKEGICNIEAISESLWKTFQLSYEGSKITWKLIEKNKNDFIYEWILHEPHKNTPPQHEIARGFLTKTAFHRIGFTHKNTQMSSAEKEKWIKLLKESTSVVSLEEAINTTESLSILDKLRDSLELGFNFQNWKIINTFRFDTGYTLVCYVPPSQTEKSYISECLEILTMPALNKASIDRLFEIEKKTVQENSFKKIDFSIHKKSPTEIIYSYSHPKDHLQLTAVVRTIISNHDYYSISYKRGLIGEMKKEEIRQCQEQLESIQFNVPSLEIFPPKNGIFHPLMGKIEKGRYYSPKNIFSCKAEDFGQGKYLSQDGLADQLYQNLKKSN